MFLLDHGPFCGAINYPCFGHDVTLPKGDSATCILPCRHAVILKAMYGTTSAFSTLYKNVHIRFTFQPFLILVEEGRQQWDRNPGSPWTSTLQVSMIPLSHAGQLRCTFIDLSVN